MQILLNEYNKHLISEISICEKTYAWCTQMMGYIQPSLEKTFATFVTESTKISSIALFKDLGLTAHFWILNTRNNVLRFA